MRVEALAESASRRVGAVINTKTPSEHVSSHLKRCQNARKMPGNAARQPGKTFNHQSVKQSIIQLHFFSFAMQLDGNSFSDRRRRRRVALPTFSALHETMPVAAAAAAVDVAAGIAVGGPVGPA